MSIDIKQFHDFILVPTLNSLGLYSKESCQLIIGTGCQESKFKYIHQNGKGPALGFFQCEPTTYKSIVNRVFVNDRNMKQRFLSILSTEIIPDVNDLIWNLKLACMICRLHYFRVQQKIPLDLQGQAEYYKKYYNTKEGAATVEEYIENYNKFASHIWEN